MQASRHETIVVFVNPTKLLRMAEEMVRRMAKAQIGESVWKETFHGQGFDVELVADQDWFHRRERGELDWDSIAPGPKALARFSLVADEAEFPQTYSGQAWRAAYRIWSATQKHGLSILNVGPYDDVKGVETKDLDLSGFMFGWAMNAVRQMLGLAPGENGAIVQVGGPSPTVPALGTAEEDMRRAIGG